MILDNDECLIATTDNRVFHLKDSINDSYKLTLKIDGRNLGYISEVVLFKNSLYFAAGNHLYRQSKTEKASIIVENPANTLITSILVYSIDSITIGTYGAGLLDLVKTGLNWEIKSRSFNGCDITSIHPINDGVLVSTWGNGCGILNRDRIERFIDDTNGIKDKKVINCFEKNNDLYVFKMYSGLTVIPEYKSQKIWPVNCHEPGIRYFMNVDTMFDFSDIKKREEFSYNKIHTPITGLIHRDGELICSTYGEGIFILSEDRQSVREDINYPNLKNYILELEINGLNEIALATQQGTLLIDLDKPKTIKQILLENNEINLITYINNSTLLINSLKEGAKLFVRDRGEDHFTSMQNSYAYNCISKAFYNGDPYFGTTDGKILKWNNGLENITLTPFRHSVSALKKFENKIIVGTAQGILIYDEIRKKWILPNEIAGRIL